MSGTRTAGRRESRTAGRRAHAGGSRRAAVAPVDPDATIAIDLTAPPPGSQDPSRSAGAPTSSRSRARVQHRARAPRHRLLLACVAVLSVGLLAVLLLKTIISQGAFRQHALEIELILLAEKEEALARAVQSAESPLSVEKAARALGMVPAGSPVFLRLEDGRILGEPVPAPSPTGPVSFKDAPGIQPTKKPKASASPAASPSPEAGVAAEAGVPSASAAPAATAAGVPAVGPTAATASPPEAPAATPSAAAATASDPSAVPTPAPTQSGVTR